MHTRSRAAVCSGANDTAQLAGKVGARRHLEVRKHSGNCEPSEKSRKKSKPRKVESTHVGARSVQQANGGRFASIRIHIRGRCVEKATAIHRENFCHDIRYRDSGRCSKHKFAHKQFLRRPPNRWLLCCDNPERYDGGVDREAA